MRILHVISTINPQYGGPVQGMLNLIHKWNSMGIEVVILSMDTNEVLSESLNNVRVVNLGSGLTRYKFNSRIVTWLEKNVSIYDFLIIHGIWQFHTYAVYKVVREFRNKDWKTPRVVIMPHGMLDPYFQMSRERRFKAMRNKIVWFLFERKAINFADALFFTCQEELELAQQSFLNYNPQKVVNVGYGVLPPPSEESIGTTLLGDTFPNLVNKEYFLFLGRIHPKKGVRELILGYNQLCNRKINIPDLVIAGPTDNNYANEMIQLSRNNVKIHFTGMLTSELKWSAFFGSKFFILPSYQENFGISIVEAMSCGKAVIITRNINIWKEIIHGNGGWLLDSIHKDTIESTLLRVSCLSMSEVDEKNNNAKMIYMKKFDARQYADNFYMSMKQLMVE